MASTAKIALLQDNDRKANETFIPNIKNQSFVYYIYENNTFWHKILPVNVANNILSIARSKCGIGFTCIMCIMYMFGLYTFDTGLFENYNHFSTYYSIIVLLFSLPISILYFGTLNVQISISILKSFTFWFKIYNILISNILSVIWANHNLIFDDQHLITSKSFWFILYGIYFFINMITTTMGALLDGFQLPTAITVMIPLLLAVYFYHSAFYWHFQDNTNTTVYFKLFEYERRWFVATLSSSADFNAALFFTNQSWHSFWYHNKTSLLSSKAKLIWIKINK